MQVQGLSQTPDTPVCSDSDFGFHDPGNFSTWQKGYFIEHGLGRMEEGGREAADLLEIQRGAGAPITIDGSRITVMAREA